MPQQPLSSEVVGSRSSSYEVVRIRTKFTLAGPDYAQFVLRAARACGFRTPAEVLAELLLEVGDPRIGNFVGLVDGKPRGMMITELPLSVFMHEPTIVLAYSEKAPSELVRMIGYRTREWLTACGFRRAVTWNMRHSDAAFMRGLKHFGLPSRVGGVIAFELTAEGEASE